MSADSDELPESTDSMYSVDMSGGISPLDTIEHSSTFFDVSEDDEEDDESDDDDEEGETLVEARRPSRKETWLWQEACESRVELVYVAAIESLLLCGHDF